MHARLINQDREVLFCGTRRFHKKVKNNSDNSGFFWLARCSNVWCTCQIRWCSDMWVAPNKKNGPVSKFEKHIVWSSFCPSATSSSNVIYPRNLACTWRTQASCLKNIWIFLVCLLFYYILSFYLFFQDVPWLWFFPSIRDIISCQFNIHVSMFHFSKTRSYKSLPYIMEKYFILFSNLFIPLEHFVYLH